MCLYLNERDFMNAGSEARIQVESPLPAGFTVDALRRLNANVVDRYQAAC
jgi:hypothetical protein